MVGIGEIVYCWLIRGGVKVWIGVSGIYSAWYEFKAFGVSGICSAWYEFKVFGGFGSTVSVFF